MQTRSIGFSTMSLVIACAMGGFGCGSSKHVPQALGSMVRTGGPLDHWAALYLPSDLDAASATVRDASDATSVLVPIGQPLRDAIVGATSRAFAGVMLIPRPFFEGVLVPAPAGQELWPEHRVEQLPPPDVVVACYPTEVRGHLIPGGSCAQCADKVSFRVELSFELRTLEGELLSMNRVSGESLRDRVAGTETRVALDEAIAAAAREVELALASLDIADRHLVE
jgi:hypothetical protein